MNAAKTKINILLVDDQPVVRQGLRSLLAKHGHLTSVGEAGDGEEAPRQVKRLRPDIVLLDLNMPGMDGLAVTGALRPQSPGVKVLVLSMQRQPGVVSRIMQAGARGYVLKDASPDELLHAMQAVPSRDAFFSPAVARAVLNPGIAGADERTPLARLSEREREVLVEIAGGRSNKEIAALLGVGVRTIETHRERTMQKLKIRSVAGLTKFALAHGLTSLDCEPED